jgi:hypothetical protein
LLNLREGGSILLLSVIYLTNSLVQGQQPSLAVGQSMLKLRKPEAVLEIDPHADSKAHPEVAFDQQGRLLILYRDKNRSQQEHWHLLRITNWLGAAPQREELSFSPLTDSCGPDGQPFSENSTLRISDDGNIGYAIFSGDVVTKQPCSRPLSVMSADLTQFTNVVSIDLTSMKVLSKAGLPLFSESQVSPSGELWSMYSNSRSRTLTPLTPGSNKAGSVQLQGSWGSCELQRGVIVLCTEDGKVFRIFPGEAREAGRLVPGWTINGVPRLTRDNMVAIAYKQMDGEHRLWRIPGDYGSVVSSEPLAPYCPGVGWSLAAVSSDGKSILTECYDFDSFMDAVSYTTQWGLQVIDAATLKVHATLALSIHKNNKFAVWHADRRSTIAVLENAGRLKLYRLDD